MKTRLLFLFFGFSFSIVIFAQPDSDLRWEASVSSGPFLNLFWLDFSIIGDSGGLGDPLSYANRKGKKVQSGRIDRIELKYHLNRKELVSINFGYAVWRDLFGTGNDPLDFGKKSANGLTSIQIAGFPNTMRIKAIENKKKE